MSRESQDDLIRQAMHGDIDAFAELVRLYRDAVYGYCYHRTGSFEDAQDLAQETFVRAYTRIRQLRDPAKFPAWLRKIAANICTRWAKSQKKAPPDSIHQCAAETGVHSRSEVVKTALENLPENERIVVILHYVDGYSYSEIARFLGVTEDSVRGRLYRGRAKIKSEVLKMAEDAFDENSLDEKFVVETVNRAVREAHDAYLVDKSLSRKKVEEAQSYIKQIDITAIKDPIEMGKALLGLSIREFVLDDIEQAKLHLADAETLFRKANYEEGIQDCRAQMAYERIHQGNLQAAYELFMQVEDYWKQRRLQDATITNYQYLAIARALESIGIETNWSRVLFLHAGECTFCCEDDLILYQGGAQLGVHKHNCPERIVLLPWPKVGPAPLPFVLIRRHPQAGDTLRFAHPTGRSEESIFETESDTVETPAGAFTNCARISNRIFAKSNWDGDIVATRSLWFAPGVGIVRVAYQMKGQTKDNSELIEFHIEEPTTEYLPLAVGNRWRRRWIEGEDEMGLRTEVYQEIVGKDNSKFVGIEYSYALSKNSTEC